MRFEINRQRENIIEPGKDLYDKIKGRWRQLYFKNERPITVELGCGNGEYTVGLGELNPDQNFIGVDIKGDRLYQGSSYAVQEDLKNVGFLRTKIHQLENFFEESEVHEFWLTFPDPRPRQRDEKRRLCHPRFLDMYKKLAGEGSWFKFKTDNSALFSYALDVLKNGYPVFNLTYTFDLYQSELLEDHHGIRTKYENIWHEQGEKIKYLKFQF